LVKVAQARKKTGKFVPHKNECIKFLRRQVSSRAKVVMGLAVAATVVVGSLMATNALAIPGARTISFFNPRTKQNLTVTYKRYGQFIPAAMRKINYMLRDWRTDQVVRMDPKLIDLLWEIHSGLGSRVPIEVLSGYRSPKTNAMLRRRSRGVSRYSRHMFGMASDVRFPDISLQKLRDFAMIKQRGGVGYYRGSFVHVDVGSVRHWPRMSKRQLARLFPRGNSLHVPRGVARSGAGRVPPRPLPRAVVMASAPSGVVRGNRPKFIKTPARVQLASRKPVQPKTRRPIRAPSRPIRLASSVPVPRAKPAPSIASAAPTFNGAVPLPRANPNAQLRLAALKVPKPPEIVVASASIVSFQPSVSQKREVAIARPVESSVEVITARAVPSSKPKRGLFGLASLAPGFGFGNTTTPTRVASAVKTNRDPLYSDLMKVNRTLKGDRLVSQAALEQKVSPVQLASRLGAPDITATNRSDPFQQKQPPEKKPRPFGLLSALFPMFSDDSQPLRRN
jgi:uncharacterized protein YcbK (DUF882 family)